MKHGYSSFSVLIQPAVYYGISFPLLYRSLIDELLAGILLTDLLYRIQSQKQELPSYEMEAPVHKRGLLFLFLSFFDQEYDDEQ